MNTPQEDGEVGEMRFRREILISAVRAAGLAVPAARLNSAMLYVRTDSERGIFTDEIDRFRAELAAISAAFEVQPAANLIPAVYGLWANLDAFKGSRSHRQMREFKARAAFYAGTLSSTVNEPHNGAQWFNVAHAYATLSENSGMTSMIHSREAIAGLYWGRDIRRITADANLAIKYARQPEERGLALMAWCRSASERRQRKSDVARMIEEAWECAAPNSGEAPRPDAWWKHQADTMAALSLSRYGGMMGAIQNHTASAMAALPSDAALLRAHARLTLADAYVSDREYDQAATLTLTTLRGVPRDHRQPVLFGRAYALRDRIRQRSGRPIAAVRLSEGLRVIREGDD